MTLTSILRNLAVYGFYVTVAIFLTWPLAAQLSTHLAGFDYGDGREMARHIWWYSTALRSGQSPIFQPNMAYPDGMPGGVLLWANPQQWFPAWLLALFLPVPAAANISLLFYMALNGWAAYVLARYLLNRRELPAIIAGLAFMAAPTFQGHLAGGHGGLMVAWAFPLYIWALLQLILPKEPLTRRQQMRFFALAVLFFVLSPGGHLLQAIYVTMPITAALLLWRLFQRDWRGVGWVLAVNVAGGILLGLFLLPIVSEIFGTSAYVDEGGFSRYSMDLLSVVTPSFFHPLYGALDYPRRVLGVNLEEGTSYIGVIVGLLGIIGLIRNRASRWWLLLALIAWVLALGPLLKVFDQPVSVETDGYATYISLPWALVQNLPGFSLARTPGRFNFALALAVAIMAGYGAISVFNWLKSALSERRIQAASGVVFVVLCSLILLDYRFFWPFPTTSAAIPEPITALAQRDDIRAVFDVPWQSTVAAKAGLYLQTGHQHALLAGHVTRSTPVDPAKLTVLQDTLDPTLLDAAGVDVVIVHKQYASESLLEHARQQLGEAIYENSRWAVFEPPPAEFEVGTDEWIYGEGQRYAGFELEPESAQVNNRQDFYLYAPAAGWLMLDTTLEAQERHAEIQLDRETVQRWQADGEQHLRVPVRLSEGYHTVTVAVDPPCPGQFDAVLRCRALSIQELNPYNYTPLESTAPANGNGVRFEGGITLDYAMPSSGWGNNFIWLFWQFEQAPDENAIRFIHVLDENGEPVQQFDSPINTAGAITWGEEIVIGDGLPSGKTYRVYAGWYTYPDITRYPVLSDVEGATDGWVFLGEFELVK